MKKEYYKFIPIIGGILLIIDVIYLFFNYTIHYFDYLNYFNLLNHLLFVIPTAIIAIGLFVRSRNMLLPVCFFVLAARELLWMIWLLVFNVYYPYYPIIRLLYFAVYAYIGFMGLVEFTNVFKSLVNLKTKKIWFIPAVVLIALFIYYLVSDGFIMNVTYYIDDICNICGIAAACFYIAYAKDIAKEKKSSSSSDVSDSDGYCNMAKHILLCLFTFGIWIYIWIYRTTRYLNKAPNAPQYTPVNKLLLCMFVPFYTIYWLYKHGQKIDMMYKERNLGNSEIATLCLILGIFFPLAAYIIMQDKINNLCTSGNVRTTSNNSTNKLDIELLKQYKELLDSGVITQEEFDAKKKQLLDL